MNKTIIIIVIIVILLIGGYFLLRNNNQSQLLNTNQQPTKQQTNTTIKPPPVTTNQLGENHEVIYTDSGYSPKEIKIKIEDTVTWKNESSGGSWIGSAMHPTHIIYSGTSLDEHCPDVQNVSFDECKSAKPGESWIFKFDKVGTWRYHNHVQASNFGSVIVE